MVIVTLKQNLSLNDFRLKNYVFVSATGTGMRLRMVDKSGRI